MAWGVPRRRAAGWDAPALDPAMLKAMSLIFVELMLVTAIALFFSTFSTPMLSAALHVRPVHRRALQHRPAQLRAGRRFAGRGARWRAGSTGCCRTSRSSTSRRRSSTAQPVPLGYMALTVALRGALHRRAAGRCDGRSSRGATSNERSSVHGLVATAGVDRRSSSLLLARRAVAAAGRRASARYPPPRATPRSLYLTSGTQPRAG